MKNSPDLAFSYSGLKTAVLYTIRENGAINPADLAASFQYAAVDILISKINQAIKNTNAKRLVVAGGVAANQHLRERLEADVIISVHIPPFKYCIDNGAMIAAAGDARFTHGLQADLTLTPKSSLPL